MTDSLGNICIDDVDKFNEILLARMEDQNNSIFSDSKSVLNVSRDRKDSLTSFTSSISSTEEVKSTLNLGTVTSKLSSFLSKGSTDNELDQFGNNHSLKWQYIIENWDQYKKKRNFINEFLLLGIPDERRTHAWRLCSLSYELNLNPSYSDLLQGNSTFEKLIKRDVCRTYPTNDFFKDKNGPGQNSLFNLMKAYSIYDPEVGYCQGSAFIAGILLLKLNEEDAFKVLIKLMYEYRLRELYKPCMTELGVCMHQIEGLVNDFLPDLQLHFVSNSFGPSLYASAWFLTLFSTSCSLDFAMRVLDMFLSEGLNIIFKLSLGILKVYETTLHSMDLESMVNFLQHDLMSQTKDGFQTIIDASLKFKLSPKRMKKLEKEYREILSQEKLEQTELRRLKSENSLLKHRLARLEEENCRITNELVKSQLCRAEEAEVIISLKNKLSRITSAMSDEQSEKANAHSTNNRPSNTHNPMASLSRASSSSSLTSFDYEHKSFNFKKITTPDHNSDLQDVSLEEQDLASIALNDNNLDRKSYMPNENKNLQLVSDLQEELVKIRTREAQINHEFKNTRFELLNLQEKYDIELKRMETQNATLENKLLQVKLYEADAVLHLDESRKRLSELESLWRTAMNGRNEKDVTTSLTKMSDKIAETALSLRIQELEREVVEAHAKNDANQLQVMQKDEQLKIMQQKLDHFKLDQKDLMKELRKIQCEAADIEASDGVVKERRNENIIGRVKVMELLTQLTEQRQLYSQLESKYQAMLSSDLINNCQTQTEATTPTMSHHESDYLVNDKTLEKNYKKSVNNFGKWRDIPSSIMTESIGPLEDLCLNPDDPLITSIYIQ